jgi:hypothetical protein
MQAEIAEKGQSEIVGERLEESQAGQELRVEAQSGRDGCTQPGDYLRASVWHLWFIDLPSRAG